MGGDTTLEPPQTQTEQGKNKLEQVPPHRVLVVDDSKQDPQPSPRNPTTINGQLWGSLQANK
jgi:hypothetical protein